MTEYKLDEPCWIITLDDPSGDWPEQTHWVVIGTSEAAWASIHEDLQNQGCLVCGGPQSHPTHQGERGTHNFVSQDADQDTLINQGWSIEEIVVVRRGD